jgi:hypothetical protein
MVTQDIAEFSYSKSSARSVLFGIPFGVLFGAGFLALGILSSRDLAGFQGWITVTVFFLLGALVLSRAWLNGKYRHILETRYVLNVHGLSIESTNEHRHVEWADIVAAEYFPAYDMYRFWETGQIVPAVIFLDRKWAGDAAMTQRNRVAKQLINSGLSKRPATRWLPF